MMNADQTFIVTRSILMIPKHSLIKGLHCIFQNFQRVMPRAQLSAFCTHTNSFSTHTHIVCNIYTLVYKQASEQVTKVVFVCFVALRRKSTAMVIAGRSVHLTTLFSWASLNKQLTSNGAHTFACN